MAGEEKTSTFELNILGLGTDVKAYRPKRVRNLIIQNIIIIVTVIRGIWGDWQKIAGEEKTEMEFRNL